MKWDIEIHREFAASTCACPGGPCEWAHNRLTGDETLTVKVSAK